ncbi:hypothetical protein bAD24_p00275 (plasmid) [Burkholderia sp. AD24]|nr:hypothetical protein bAD24_p00275 [Burkholderia sp. AD24]
MIAFCSTFTGCSTLSQRSKTGTVLFFYAINYCGTTMKIPDQPFTVTTWNDIPATQHPGQTGAAFWRSFNAGDMWVRMIEYTAGYLANHWCGRGHVLFVLAGELLTELKDGRTFLLTEGMSYHVSDFGDAAHRSSTRTGVRLFIVD